MAMEPNPLPKNSDICTICGARRGQLTAHKCTTFETGKIEDLLGQIPRPRAGDFVTVKTYAVKEIQFLREALVEIKGMAKAAYCGGEGACAVDTFTSIEEIASKALEATKD